MKFTSMFSPNNFEIMIRNKNQKKKKKEKNE